MAYSSYDTDFPVFRSNAEIEAFFLRAKPFVDDAPERAAISLGPDLARVGSFEKLADRAGELGAVREIVAEASRQMLGAAGAPHVIVFPNGWVALVQHPAVEPPDLRVAICPFEGDSTALDKINAAVARVLLGLRDLSGNKTRSAPLPSRSTDPWSDALSALLDRDRLEEAYKSLVAAREKSGNEQPRRPRSSMVDGFLRWLSANMPRPAPEERARPQAPGPAARSARAPVDLKLHVVNMRFGELSDDGQFQTTPSDVAEIARNAAAWIGARAGRRLAIYAHGGLVGEGVAIKYAEATAGWWLENEVYPIFCVWESDAVTTILRLVDETLGGRRTRAFGFGELRDAAVERLVNSLGTSVWSTMKRSAQLASADGDQHGLTLLVKLLRETFGTTQPSLHLVGHSAGAIMLLYLLPRLKAAGLGPKSFQTLAPAATTSLYRKGLLAHGPTSLECRMYTMTDANERNDTAGPYGKSMLYLVSRGFERTFGEPISGLQKDLLADRALLDMLSAGVKGVTREALVFSKTPPGTPRRLQSDALRHSAFNDDLATMWSVMHFIRGPGEADLISRFPTEAVQERGASLDAELEELPEEVRTYLALVGSAGAPASAVPSAGPAAPVPARPRPTARRALTIGIDEYGPGTSLRGCVNDSDLWRSMLSERGFDVAQHTRPEETGRDQILRLLREFVGPAAAGDTLVWHYSGHGIEVEPDPGPGDDEPTGFDQAIVGATRATDLEGMLAAAVIDDEIHEVLRGVHPQASLYVFLDSCFSGSATRLALAGRPRTLGTIRRRGYVPRMRLLTAPHVGARGPYDGANHVLFSAASATQVALENGAPPNGVFTRAVSELLRNKGARLTNEDFRLQVSDLVGRDPSVDQTPGLYCDPGRRTEPFPLL